MTVAGAAPELDFSKSVPVTGAAPSLTATAPQTQPAPQQGAAPELDFSKAQVVGGNVPPAAPKELPPFNPKVAGRYTTEANYPTWAKTHPKIGPDAKAGEYEAWSGVQEGTNKDQAIAGAKNLGMAAVETAAGVTGATAIGELGAVPGAAEAIMGHLEKHAAEYAAKYPNLIKLAGALGIPTTAAGVLLYFHHNSK